MGTNREQYPISNAPLEAIIGVLLLRMAQDPGKMYYLDIYPVDPTVSDDGYTYELTEHPRES